jgi:ZIP family zinc transporter
MNGFAAGVMIASSVWSLIIPATEMSSEGALPSFLPAAIGLWIGIIFFFALDKILDNFKTIEPATEKNHILLTLLAIILHNFPEGMALGVMCAGLIANSPQITLAAATSLAVGIGVQNFPEGSIISVPLHASGKSKLKSFGIGILSAVAETLGSLLMILASTLVLPILPYVMCFAAGAMIFVVINELCPEISEGAYIDLGTLAFCTGFSLMMILDVALG